MTFCDQCGARLGAAADQAPACPHCAVPRTGALVPAPRPPVEPGAWTAGRPTGPGSAGRWLRAGITAHPAGAIAAFASAWLGVPLAVMLGAVGAVAGAIMGAFSGTPIGEDVRQRVWTVFDVVLPIPVDVPSLIPDMAWQVGSMLGLIIGAVWGGAGLAWLGLSGSWRLLWEGDPMWPVTMFLGNVAAAVLLALGYTVAMILTERWRLSLCGARAPSDREAAALRPALGAAAAALGSADLPVALIIDDPEPEVRAHSRHLTLTRGFLAAHIDAPERMTALIGRELVHWRDGHPVTALWVRGIALPLALVYDLAARLFAPSTDTRARPLMFVWVLLLWPVAVTVRHVLAPSVARWWHRATFGADQAAAAAGWGPHIAADIATREDAGAGVRTWRAVLTTTPPAEARLQALQDAAGVHRDLTTDLTDCRKPTGRRPGLAVGTPQRTEANADAH